MEKEIWKSFRNYLANFAEEKTAILRIFRKCEIIKIKMNIKTTIDWHTQRKK